MAKSRRLWAPAKSEPRLVDTHDCYTRHFMHSSHGNHTTVMSDSLRLMVYTDIGGQFTYAAKRWGGGGWGSVRQTWVHRPRYSSTWLERGESVSRFESICAQRWTTSARHGLPGVCSELKKLTV